MAKCGCLVIASVVGRVDDSDHYLYRCLYQWDRVDKEATRIERR
jgi:hypothetical protein